MIEVRSNPNLSSTYIKPTYQTLTYIKPTYQILAYIYLRIKYLPIKNDVQSVLSVDVAFGVSSQKAKLANIKTIRF